MTQFIYYHLTGNDAEKFLQGQVTCDTKKLTEAYTPTAICNLKGRVHFGLWIKKSEDGFGLVMAEDLAEDFAKHIKKYGAFSKISLSEVQSVNLTVKDSQPGFDEKKITLVADFDAWAKASMAAGNYWLTKTTSELFQPQELRLHQRDGVSYDKGCYLGQEIVARLYFKASPKAYLHRIAFNNPKELGDKVQIINQIATEQGFEALVVARPDDLADIKVLPLPDALKANIGRH